MSGELPFAFQLLQSDLDGHQPKHRAVVADMAWTESSPHARGHADAVEAAWPSSACCT
jgi:hypothetical protein